MGAGISNTSSGGGSLSVDTLSGIEKSLIDSSEKTAECKERDKEMMKNEDNHVVKDQYLKNISEMLDFCSDVNKFVTSACDSQSEIVDLIEQIEMEDDRSERDVEELIDANVRMVRCGQISKKLEHLKACDDDITTHKLLQTLKCLLVQHEEMLESLQKQKLDQKYSSSRAWRMAAKLILLVIQVVFVGIGAAVTAGLIVVSPIISFFSALAIGISPLVPMISLMIDSWMDRFENLIKSKSDLMNPMRVGTRRATADLGDLKRSIGLIVNDIDSLLGKVEILTEGQSQCMAIKGIKKKLKKLRGTVEALEDQTNKCSTEMVKAREKALGEL